MNSNDEARQRCNSIISGGGWEATEVRADGRSAQEFRWLTGGVSVRMSREN